MKKTRPLQHVLLFLCALVSFNLFAQLSDDNVLYCGQEQKLAQLLGADPQALARQLAIENRIYNDTRNGLTGNSARSTVLYTLPVVVHVIHNNGAENIPD
ncbi:MAG TPA: hypothetical protein PLW44_17760, partial [Chitinophagales bacterium]|nr:hypothetical protein [Chitinophagales bacterium]